jgi:hypothetical protein
VGPGSVLDGWRRKKSRHYPCRELKPGLPACSLVSILTEARNMICNGGTGTEKGTMFIHSRSAVPKTSLKSSGEVKFKLK